MDIGEKVRALLEVLSKDAQVYHGRVPIAAALAQQIFKFELQKEQLVRYSVLFRTHVSLFLSYLHSVTPQEQILTTMIELAEALLKDELVSPAPTSHTKAEQVPLSPSVHHVLILFCEPFRLPVGGLQPVLPQLQVLRRVLVKLLSCTKLLSVCSVRWDSP